MPSSPTPYFTRASSTVSPDTQENGTVYENTIPDASSIRVFVFNQTDGIFIEEVTDLNLIGSPDATSRLLKGSLSSNTLGKTLHLVLMANYAFRDCDPATPVPGQTYAEWSLEQKLLYGTSSWHSSDQKFLPMSGEGELVINTDPSLVNQCDLLVRRAVAKVRLKVKADCKFSLTEISTVGASNASFALPQFPFAVPPQVLGADWPMCFSFPQALDPSDTHEFYITEQAPEAMTISFKFARNGQTIDKVETISFKNYTTGTPYPVERNHIYEFSINKKEDAQKTDVSTAILPWTVITVDTVFE